MTRTLAVIASLAASLALAQNVPGSISFNARLADTAGAAITGAHAMSFGLYDQAAGGAAVWTESVPGASFSTEGVAYLELGAVTPLTTAALDGRKLYLEVSVDGTTMAPRLAIVSVPYALRASVAATAGSVGSLTESAIQRRVTGTCGVGQAVRSIDAAGGVQCEALGDITAVSTATGSGLTGGAMSGDVALGLTACAAGEVLKSSGASWACAADAVGATYAVNAPLALSGSTLSLSGCPNNQLLKSNGTTWVCADAGTVTGVTASAPLLSSGGAAPNLTLPQANGSTAGFISAADWNTFNTKRSVGGRNLIDWLPNAASWVNSCGNVATVSVEGVDHREGNSSFQFDVLAVNTSGSCTVYGDFIPVDPTLVYSGRVVAKLVAGTGPFFAGVATYDGSKVFIANRYFIANAVVLVGGAWTPLEGQISAAGTGQGQFPANTRFVRPLVNPNFNNLGITRVDSLELWAAEPTAPRIARAQLSFGTLTCNTTAPLPGGLSFVANAGEWVTLTFHMSGRTNACGHVYADLLLDGVLQSAASADERGCTWRRTLSQSVNVQLTTSGVHTFSANYNCGSGATNFSDNSGEWPRGGLTYTAHIGG